MELILAIAGLAILGLAVTLSHRVGRRYSSTADGLEDEYWLTVRQAEVATRSGAPFV